MRRPSLTLAVFAALLAGACGGSDEPIEPPTAFPGASPFRYPEELLDIEAVGETVLMVHVTTAGVVDSAYVLEPAAWSAFDSAALAGARDLRFSPARQGARRVSTWTRLPVRFAPDTTGAPGLTAPPLESPR